MMPKKKVAHADDRRSAVPVGQPAHGRMPRTRKPPEMPATNTMTPELTWNDAWMLGASDAQTGALQVVQGDDDGQHARTSWSRDLRRPSRSDMCSSRVPGSRSSGSSTSSAACAALWRSCSRVGQEAGQIGCAVRPGDAAGVTAGGTRSLLPPPHHQAAHVRRV